MEINIYVLKFFNSLSNFNSNLTLDSKLVRLFLLNLINFMNETNILI